MDKGSFKVGRTGNKVAVEHRNLKADKNGVGCIVFTPLRARRLAALLNKCAGRNPQRRLGSSKK
jgi:hypothetical protein